MISIIIPTFNEKKNINELVERILCSMPECEIIFVDDNSPDGTSNYIIDLMKDHSCIKLITRPEKTGLASAVTEGFKIAKYDTVCVMDADLSHPPEALPGMYKIIREEGADIIVGSRLVKGGGSTYWPWYRQLFSLAARLVAQPLTRVKDLTSGYFMFKKQIIEGITLNPIGFKICLEVLTKGKYDKVVEFPIVFVDRGKGKSKMGIKETLEYFKQVAQLYAANKRRNRS
ncbi:MAG: polyprenol monophosphomannose synthase [Candidatus Margulisiibacteriota bacterium]